jgi:hypothetical protein
MMYLVLTLGGRWHASCSFRVGERDVTDFGASPWGVSMRQAGNRELFAYWKRLKGQRSAPERNDIDPGAIRAILSDVFILELDREAGLPFRVAGVRTNALFGRELRGSKFLELWRSDDRHEIADLAHATAGDAQPVVLAGIAHSASHAAIGAEILLLPLRHHGNTHARLLGAFSPGAMPKWIGLDEIRMVEYVTSRILFDSDFDQENNIIDRYSPVSSSFDIAMNRRKQFYVISREL